MDLFYPRLQEIISPLSKKATPTLWPRNPRPPHFRQMWSAPDPLPPLPVSTYAFRDYEFIDKTNDAANNLPTKNCLKISHFNISILLHLSTFPKKSKP
jgi:hypothetical protein